MTTPGTEASTTRPLTPRARARADAISRIKELALAQLADSGPASLSLRAIARELGIVSSALYRYFPSRDALLTALIVDAYQDLATTLDHAARDHRPAQRWMQICMALRRWAHEEPHRFALIYGTPVPGYAAPAETIEPATQVMAQFLQVAATATGPVPDDEPPSAALTEQLHRLTEALQSNISPQRALAAVGVIGQLFGLLTLELGGHLVGTFEPAEELYAHSVTTGAQRIGL
ncbi:TetR/AcrR family transcriptional regulator [Pseudactinotalea sp. Z1748]|uniref:TetR/AcrR family transcriptional regulator n=1 Tax=Pseudactinotalea sp. Z1748 TaxID=3413027 RepID=UPI003C7D03A3